MNNPSPGVSSEALEALEPLLEYSPDAMLIAGPDGRILRASRALAELLGYAPDELAGQPVELLVPEGLRAGHARHARGFADAPTARPMSSGLELAARRRDGTEIPVDISLMPIERGGRTLVACALRDLRARKRAESELRRFRLAMDTSIDSIYLTDARTMRFVDVNAAACRRLGYRREELLEMGPHDVLAVDREALGREYERVIAAGDEGVVTESAYVTRGGVRAWTELHRRALRSEGRWLIVTVGRDITERKRAAEALARSEQRFRDLTELSSDWVFELDEHLRFTALGLGSGDKPHLRPPDYVGHQPWELPGSNLGPEQWAQYRAMLQAHAAFRDFEYCRPSADGKLRWVSVSGAPVFDEAGRFTGYRGVGSDITERKRSEEALRASAAQLRLVADNVPAMIVYLDAEYRFRYANRAYREFFTRGEALEGRTLAEVLGEGVWQAVRVDVDRALRGEPLAFERTHRAAGGAFRNLEVSLVPHRGEDGRVLGAYALLLDVTERRGAEEALRLRTRALEASVNSVVITEPSPQGQVAVYVNPAFERMTGYRAAEVLGRSLRILRGEDADQPGIDALRLAIREQRETAVLLRDRRKDGTPYWTELHVAPVRDADGHVTHFVGVGNDVTERVRYQDQLEHHANHDPLTGLPNRNLLNDRLEQGIAVAARSGTITAVLYLDLDDFKRINDSLGHAVGDQVIGSVARRLVAALRKRDTIARVGGDEFVIVLSELKSPEDAALVAEKVRAAIAEPLALEGNEFLLSSSVGVALCPRDGVDRVTLLRNSDTALYRAKEEGRDCFRFFAQEMNAQVVAKLAIERDLRRALEAREFRLEYQPIVRLATQRIVGAEALIRWRRPDGSLVPPAQFIPVAEESGLIVPIGRWVLHEAAREAARWPRPGGRTLAVSVNLSARQFRDPRLVETVASALAEAPLEGARLKLEITESTVMQNAEETVGTLRALKALGVGLAVDDFGTGYSSLAYLKRFALDTLKIDREFVHGLPADRDDVAICRSVIDLAHAIGLTVVAEGIETEAQMRLLASRGCDLGQGYFFSTPLAPGDFATLLGRS